MELDFITLDVFTSTRFQGNPLAIIKVPAHLSAQLTQAHKQLIAREFNLSETAFLHQKSPQVDEWSLDIFTTQDELPFAGHPTVGAACYVLNMENQGSFVNGMAETAGMNGTAGGKRIAGKKAAALITKAGRIEITGRGNGVVAASISHNVRIHHHTISDLAEPDIGLSSNTILANAEKHAPLVSIVKGMTFLLVQLPSLELLKEAQSTSRHLSFYQLLDEGWEEGFVARYFYVLEQTGPNGQGNGEGGKGVLRIRTRMMEATMEDPATGSAACALGSYLALSGVGLHPDGRTGVYEITQGVEMGRKSIIGVEVEVEAGGKKIQSVKLAGSAVKVMEGKIRV